MASIETKTSSTQPAGVAELLPDPAAFTGTAGAGDADDLIASIAEQQIDALISDAHADTEKPTSVDHAAELAQQATNELAQMAHELNEQVSADLVADLTHAASEAVARKQSTHDTVLGAPEPTPVATPLPEAAPATEAPVSAEHADSAAPTPEPIPVQIGEPAVAAPLPEGVAKTTTPLPEPLPAVGPSISLTPQDTEINQDEIDALISTGAAPASEEPLSDNPTVPETLQPAVAAAESSESSAAEVARELAEQAAVVAAHLPSLRPATAPGRARESLSSGVLTFLSWVNYPARNLSDNTREVIGIIAIVTLVNAMSLLLYLMIFG